VRDRGALSTNSEGARDDQARAQGANHGGRAGRIGRRNDRLVVRLRAALSDVLSGHRLRRHAEDGRRRASRCRRRRAGDRQVRCQCQFGAALALPARAAAGSAAARRGDARPLHRGQSVRPAGHRDRHLQCRTGKGGALLQQARVLLLHRADLGARPGSLDAGGVLRRSGAGPGCHGKGCNHYYLVVYVLPRGGRPRAAGKVRQAAATPATRAGG
jgi:hypothetical protein